MGQVCFFMGAVSGLVVYRSFGMSGVMLLGLSDIVLYVCNKIWGD